MMNFDAEIDRFGTGSIKWDKYKDRDIIPFWVADMDFRSPEPVIEAMKERIDHGVFGYTVAPDSCVSTVIDYLNRVHQFEAKPEWLIWTPGLVPALTLACGAFAEAGDSILTMTPVYYPFLTAPKYNEQELLTVPLDLQGEEWVIDFDGLEKVVTNATKVLILSNPHNPVGKVMTQDELERLGEFVVRHDLILCSDEIHSDLILNGKEHFTAGRLAEEVLDRTVLMFSPSKTYNLAGLACAYLVVPNIRVRTRLKMAMRGIITEVNCVGYASCEAAYKYGEKWRGGLLGYLEENRRLLYDFIREQCDGVKVYPMDATYLAWIDVRSLKLENPAEHFEKFGIGLSPGALFGGSGYVRFNFGCPKSTMLKGLKRFKAGLESL